MDSPPKHSPVLGAQPVKGILKKPAASFANVEKTPSLKWDEENLTITEAQKDSTMKIDEPKTPFVYYDHAQDKVLDSNMEDFVLDKPKKKQAALAHTPPVPSYMPGLNDDEDEDEDENGDEDNESYEDDSDEFEEDIPQEQGQPNDPDEWQDSDEEEVEQRKAVKKHDKFAKMRAEHYKMRDALRLGHKLAEQDLQSPDSPRDSSAPVPPVPGLPSSIKPKGGDDDLDMDI
ncbi:hypothetical protein DFQ27_007831 [Actinomortierella ambigua]|uniref:Protein phosphatase inhibitor 2 n=1 Tax=Actinomortierella ambigua TaxID=1343610 RepID=A0A9P6UBI7_9FUNG|nr:hypothetical protein DFQ27_007831 [Actinomortierella ambigua]